MLSVAIFRFRVVYLAYRYETSHRINVAVGYVPQGSRCRDRIWSAWEAYLRWKTRGFPGEARAFALILSSVVLERNKVDILLYLKHLTHVVSTNECLLDRQRNPNEGYKVS